MHYIVRILFKAEELFNLVILYRTYRSSELLGVFLTKILLKLS